jgi:hypothetical protein
MWGLGYVWIFDEGFKPALHMREKVPFHLNECGNDLKERHVTLKWNLRNCRSPENSMLYFCSICGCLLSLELLQSDCSPACSWLRVSSQAKISLLSSPGDSEDEATCTEATLKSGDYFGYGEVINRSLHRKAVHNGWLKTCNRFFN